MTAREMEQRLLDMQEEFKKNPTAELRAEYRALWERWCGAKGIRT